MAFRKGFLFGYKLELFLSCSFQKDSATLKKNSSPAERSCIVKDIHQRNYLLSINYFNLPVLITIGDFLGNQMASIRCYIRIRMLIFTANKAKMNYTAHAIVSIHSSWGLPSYKAHKLSET